MHSHHIKTAVRFACERERAKHFYVSYARIDNKCTARCIEPCITRVELRKNQIPGSREGGRGEGIKRKEEGGTLETQKPPRNFEGDVRAGEKEEERLPGAGGGEGDNCRRASLLRCSCKEVLRRDKAAAITIEPRGNSLPTCYTHTHTRVYVLRARARCATRSI